MPKKIEMPSDEKAKFLLDVVEDRKAVDPTLLDLRGQTVMTDFFLICSGTSNVHIRSIADNVLEKSEEQRLNKPRVEGQSVGEWVLIDFGDVVIHVMDEESRARYQLEKFWTTPQPKGALPPTPSSVENGAGPGEVYAGRMLQTEGFKEYDQGDETLEDDEDDDVDDVDEVDLEDDELEDAAFFADADTEVEPVDEDDLDDAPNPAASKPHVNGSTPHA